MGMMKLRLVLVALAAVVSAANVADHPFPKTTIEIPLDRVFQVVIHLRHEYKCIGSIISAHFILTTAYCIESRGIKNAPLSDISISEGTTTASEARDNHEVDKIIIHPEYKANSNNEKFNDIALIKVKTHFHSNHEIYHIGLFKTGEKVKNGSTAELTGFSRSAGPDGDAGLIVDFIPVFDAATCATFYPDGIPDGQICAGLPGNSACEGDEGTPLVVDDSLIGVASSGLDDCSSIKRPALFTEIAHYYDWISNTINSLENDLVVAIEYQYQHHCEGLIISPYHVLTAGLCVRAAFAHELKIRIDFDHANTEEGRSFKVDQIHVHPNLHKTSNGNPVNDIAILRVKEKFPFVHNKTNLLEANEKVDGGIIGQTAISNLSSEGIYIGSSVLDVTIVDKEKCNEEYEDLHRSITDDQICVSEVYNYYHWQANRGSPLFVDDRAAGILSCYGICKSTGNRPTTYTNIGSYRSWIDDYLSKDNKALKF